MNELKINKKIDGYLDSLILNSSENVEIIIESELGYLIFQRGFLTETNHFTIRNRITTPSYNQIDPINYDRFLLNEKLIVTMFGLDQDIEIIIRYE